MWAGLQPAGLQPAGLQPAGLQPAGTAWRGCREGKWVGGLHSGEAGTRPSRGGRPTAGLAAGGPPPGW